MTGVAIGVGVAGAAVAAGTSLANASSAKKGAANATQAQQQATDQSIQLGAEGTKQANAALLQNYLSAQGVLGANNQQNINFLSPYANAGAAANNQIMAGIAPGGGEIAPTAAQGSDPQTVAQWNNQLQQLQAQAAEAQRGADAIMQNLQAMGASYPPDKLQQAQQQYNQALQQVQQIQPQIQQLTQQIQVAQQTPYVAANPGRAATPAGGGNLIRNFTAADYSSSPLAGGTPGSPGTYYNATSFAGAGNANISPQQIQQWFAQNPGASDAQIIAEMQKNGISAQQIAQATGTPIDQVNQRISSVIDPSTVKAGTPGAAPPDLTKNFDTNAYLGAAGMTQADLIKQFNTDAYLKKAGLTTADLIKPFDEKNFLKQGGRNLGDLTRKYDPNAFLKQGGMNQGDLFRSFTMNDYQADPGYAFRLAQGNEGINNAAASQGNLLSGATLKAIADYNSGAASQEYGNAYNRFTTTQGIAQNALNSDYNRYAGDQANLGNQLNAAQSRYASGQGVAQAGLNSAIGAYQSGQGIAQAGLNQANNFYNLDRQNASNLYQQIYGNYVNDQNNQFNKLMQVSQQGQNAANNQASLNQGYGSNLVNAGNMYYGGVANNINNLTNSTQNAVTNQGNANAAGIYAATNAGINSNTQIANGLMQGIGTGLYGYGQVQNPQPVTNNYNNLNPNWSINNSASGWGNLYGSPR